MDLATIPSGWGGDEPHGIWPFGFIRLHFSNPAVSNAGRYGSRTDRPFWSWGVPEWPSPTCPEGCGACCRGAMTFGAE
jgi:hypothetical protein